MARLRRTERTVKNKLETKPATREDDFLLILYTYDQLTEKDIITMPFGQALIEHRELGLPSFETVTRCRRKLQDKYQWLRPSEEEQAIRHAEEQEFLDYARS
ncbi:hypothetical protein [Megamonas hypermegale]|uniref:hypothetical protein n=1 Tax=Megamonas hypermegale TaxID=158847 RepID=UPI0026ED5F90|nr:hypothetical protein [Megamonas hypermegale]